MFTRSDYLTGVCTHRQYYSQFVNNDCLRRVEFIIGVDKIKESKDPYFNDIPLSEWDKIFCFWHTEIKRLVEEAQDYPTPAVGVCIAKEAAQQIKEKEVVNK